MKIPKRIKIAGHNVVCRSVRTLSHKTRNWVPKEWGDCWGSSCNQTNEILIARFKRGMPINEAHRSSTLLHEILHQIDYKYCLELGEKRIGKIEAALFQVLRDNKLDFSDRGK